MLILIITLLSFIISEDDSEIKLHPEKHKHTQIQISCKMSAGKKPSLRPVLTFKYPFTSSPFFTTIYTKQEKNHTEYWVRQTHIQHASRVCVCVCWEPGLFSALFDLFLGFRRRILWPCTQSLPTVHGWCSWQARSQICRRPSPEIQI